MIVTALSSMNGEILLEGKPVFQDVNVGAYYYEEEAWANGADIKQIHDAGGTCEARIMKAGTMEPWTRKRHGKIYGISEKFILNSSEGGGRYCGQEVIK